MDTNSKRYNNLVTAYKKAYPDVKKALQFERAQKLWNNIKNDSKKYEETLVELQMKRQRRENKQLSFWSSLKQKAAKPTQSINQPSSQNLEDTPRSPYSDGSY